MKTSMIYEYINSLTHMLYKFLLLPEVNISNHYLYIFKTPFFCERTFMPNILNYNPKCLSFFKTLTHQPYPTFSANQYLATHGSFITTSCGFGFNGKLTIQPSPCSGNFPSLQSWRYSNIVFGYKS